MKLTLSKQFQILGMSALIGIGNYANAQNNRNNNGNNNNRNNNIRVVVNSTSVEEQAVEVSSWPSIFSRILAWAKQSNDRAAQNLYGVSRVVSEIVYEDIEDGNWADPLYFDDVLTQVMDVIAREQGKFPVITGNSGSGKSTLIRYLAKRILNEEIPGGIHAEELANGVVLEVSARNFLAGGPINIIDYLIAASRMADQVKVKPIVVITDIEMLDDYHASVLKEHAEDYAEIPVILEASNKAYSQFSSQPGIKRYLSPIKIPTITKDQILDLVKKVHLGRLEARYNVKFDDDSLKIAVELSNDYRRDLSYPSSTLSLLEDVAVAKSRKMAGRESAANRKDIFTAVATKLNMPVVPQDEAAFSNYIKDLRKRVLAKVIDQDALVNGLIDMFQSALTSRNRTHQVAMVMGSTGVGKTYIAEQIALEFYGSKERVLELDMTQFSEKHQISALIGAPPGYVGYGDKGALVEFLDGAGRGGGIIIMNEIEEAHAEVITRLMELFDRGEIMGGDGKIRHLGRSLVVLTSNKNSESILPAERIRGMTKSELEKYVAGITQEQLKKAWTEKKSYTQDDSKVIKSAVPERIDRFFFAPPVLNEGATKITELEVLYFARSYETNTQTKLNVDPAFSAALTNAFYNEQNGARQMKVLVSQTLSKAIEAFKEKYGSKAKVLNITASLHPSKKTESFVTISDGTNSLTINGPRVPVANPLLDAEFRERLQKLEENIASEIFGQKEAIQSVAGAAKSRFLRAGDKKPAAGFLIGTTGTGKTQIAKTTAKYLYGREDAVGIFEMGRVNDQSDLNDIMSPPKGYVGSDQPGQLEQFLKAFPDGGILLFDEMSNAGGNNIALKNSIMKQFYGMLEEGVYKSPSGKAYDLSKYLILFTGNDGEEIFKGYTSDTFLEESYAEATKNPETVKDILRKAGIPDAFLGRLAFVTLMRPTVKEVKIMIANKMISKWVRDVQRTQPFDIQYDENFVSEIAELMYSPQSGARSITHFIDQILGLAVADEALRFDWNELLENGKRGQIKLSLKVQRPKLPFYTGDTPDKREAILVTEVFQNGKPIGSREVEFTSKAFFMPQVSESSALATAYHEMGHAIASYTDVTGKKVIKITIVPENIGGELSAAGYTQYRSVPSKVEFGREKLVKNVAGLLAGSEAESMYGQTINIGRSNDVERAGELIRKVVLERHLIPELDGAHAYVDKDGQIVNNLPADKKQVFDSFVNKIIDEARALAIATLKEDWKVVAAGAELLMKQGTINEKEFEELVKKYKSEKENCNQLLAGS